MARVKIKKMSKKVGKYEFTLCLSLKSWWTAFSFLKKRYRTKKLKIAPNSTKKNKPGFPEICPSLYEGI